MGTSSSTPATPLNEYPSGEFDITGFQENIDENGKYEYFIASERVANWKGGNDKPSIRTSALTSCVQNISVTFEAKTSGAKNGKIELCLVRSGKKIYSVDVYTPSKDYQVVVWDLNNEHSIVSSARPGDVYEIRRTCVDSTIFTVKGIKLTLDGVNGVSPISLLFEEWTENASNSFHLRSQYPWKWSAVTNSPPRMWTSTPPLTTPVQQVTVSFDSKTDFASTSALGIPPEGFFHGKLVLQLTRQGAAVAKELLLNRTYKEGHEAQKAQYIFNKDSLVVSAARAGDKYEILRLVSGNRNGPLSRTMKMCLMIQNFEIEIVGATVGASCCIPRRQRPTAANKEQSGDSKQDGGEPTWNDKDFKTEITRVFTKEDLFSTGWYAGGFSNGDSMST